MPWSEGALAERRGVARRRVMPVPSSRQPAPAGERDVAAVTYAATRVKKGLDRVLAAWDAARRGDGEELVVAGVDRARRRDGVALRRPRCAPEDFRALLRRARVFVAAPRREDYGIAQLEALADGCRSCTTPAPGPYAALPLAARLDPRLVGEDLAAGAARGARRTAARLRRRARSRRSRRSAATPSTASSPSELLPRLLG